MKIFEYEINMTIHTAKHRNVNSLQGWDLLEQALLISFSAGIPCF